MRARAIASGSPGPVNRALSAAASRPERLGYKVAAAVAVSLLTGANELGRSGVDVEDTSRDFMLDSTSSRLGADGMEGRQPVA